MTRLYVRQRIHFGFGGSSPVRPAHSGPASWHLSRCAIVIARPGRRVLVEPSDCYRLKCISNDVQWCRLTRGTRLIQEAARKIEADRDVAEVDRGVATSVRAIVQKLEQGSHPPELVLAEIDGAMVLVEGHKRATAYAILNQPFAAFLGTSLSMGDWHYGRDR